MISTHRIETLAKGLQLQPETLRRIVSGERRMGIEEMRELERRLNAMTGKVVTSDTAVLNPSAFSRGV